MSSSFTARNRTVHDPSAAILAHSSNDEDWLGSRRYGRGVDQPPAQSDTIAEVMRFVQMAGIFYCPSELTEPWGLQLPPMADCVWFHAVTHGACTIEVDGDSRTVQAGDLVVIPHGTGHRVWGEMPAPTPDVFDLPHNYYSDRYALLRHGGGGKQTDVVCGGIRFSHPAARHLIDALPTIIHTEASRSTRANWMQATLELMAEETRHVRPGSEAVISRLCDIVVIQAIRTWIERDPGAHTGWLGALRDEQIGTAIAAIHANPETRWTVTALAAEASMSRSAFAARFTSLVGEPAMHYVARWRMHVALELLRTDDSTIAAIAAQVGYDSEAAFSRAFKRVIGTPPQTARRRDPNPNPR